MGTCPDCGKILTVFHCGEMTMYSCKCGYWEIIDMEIDKIEKNVTVDTDYI